MAWPDRTKFKNQKVSLDGYSFASKLEAAVFSMIKAQGNEVLQVQDHIYLTEARILYIPDFKCKNTTTGEIYWAEAKGYEDQKWPIKLRLWRYYGPGKLEVWRGSAARPYLDETVVVKDSLSRQKLPSSS